MPHPSVHPDSKSRTPAVLHRKFKSQKNKTLLGKILIWMFGPLFLLWSIGIVITYFIAQNIANAPYDRTLTDHLRLLKYEVEQQNVREGVKLSASTLTVLSGENGRPTRWQIRDANGASLAGNSSIPLPDNWAYEKDKFKFHNETIDGQSVRVAYVWGARDRKDETFLTLVAETNDRRGVLQQEILTGMLTPQLIVLPLAALLAGLGLTQGLEPLSVLQERIRARRPNDFSAISEDLAPAEIAPLVAAMNELLAQLAAGTESQRRFVSNAAHQLKTPLAGMRTQAELALREKDPAKVEQSLHQLVKGTERATRLVNQLLALTRAEHSANPGQFVLEKIDLNALAETQTRQFVDQAMHHGVDLGFEAQPSPQWIQGHGLLLSELVANLIDNALLYTPAGGWATVRVIAGTATAGIEVEDSGSGIAPQHRARVFDRFFRVWGNSADGSGLGLSIVKEIADQHGARVELVEPSAERGARTCFRVTFRRALHPQA
ncbi:MAG TPA: sensor histidine kinase N-terminal domain-containing protein [Pusillimonas sp.]|uniref:sensor histidine kinase n=1 Tax=Pusillimonas sp. TaxID=3040095 RepID=UPI002CC6FFC6|nr:sensor histidine kinase N-terminal domain-containing protein [Pusillimonas sp.]HUH86469.1 sensor histidine kinase N-terminal domain-containing protein [Pusillimonas sp.]